MKKTKKQHMVPRCHLQRFADSKGHIWVYDKQEDKQFFSNIEDVAEENCFYDIPADQAQANAVDPQFMEKGLLQEIDDMYARSVSTIIDSGQIDGETRWNLSRCLAIQNIRTRNFRTKLLQHAQLMTQHMIRIEFPEFDPELYSINFDEYFITSSQNQMMLDTTSIEETANILFNHIWIIGNVSTATFYTSDSPLVRMGHGPESFWGNDGLASLGVEIVFPLSPNHLLLLWERTHFHNSQHLDTTILPLNCPNVLCYNELQVLKSNRFVYSNNDDFSLARYVCQRNQRVRDPERARIK